MISRFYEQFSQSSRNLGHFWKFEKISNKHIIHHFEADDLELILNFEKDKSNNVFREVLKCFRKIAKFKFQVSGLTRG